MENERLLKANVSYVGDMRSAIDGIPHDRRIVVDTPMLKTRLMISEITVTKDGELVFYVDVP